MYPHSLMKVLDVRLQHHWISGMCQRTVNVLICAVSYGIDVQINLCDNKQLCMHELSANKNARTTVFLCFDLCKVQLIMQNITY